MKIKYEIVKVHLCSLFHCLYYTTQRHICQVKIMLSPLGVVLWNTRGGLFWGKAGRFENEMTFFKMKMKCRFLQRCAVFLFILSHIFCLIPIRTALCHSFFVGILQKIFFAFFHIALSIRCTHSASAACMEYCCHRLSHYSIPYLGLGVKLELR